MAKELIPIRVRIGIKPNGHADYPNFNSISSGIRQGLDWSHYVDIYGLAWHYDKTSGHKENTIDSPLGQQWGVLIVPPDFAEAAISQFPDRVTKLTEAELGDFYDNKAHVREPDEVIDEKVLSGIQAKQDLGLPLTTQQTAVLDPEDDTPGIVRNKKKTWAEFKTLVDVSIPIIAAKE